MVIVVCTALLLGTVKLSGAFDGLDRYAFDLVSSIAPPRPDQPAAVIVAIDEASFSAVGKPWPWPRDIHAQLIRSLRKAGARKIGFDVVFADRTSVAADDAFAATADSQMILGADETVADTPQGTMLVRTEPLVQFTQHGARVGVTSVAVDPDGVVRRIPRYPESFAQQFLPRPQLSAGQDRLIQYFGGPRTYPYVSYYQALDAGNDLPPATFKGRDVIVGLVIQANPEVRQAPDSFETAFTARDGRLVPGAEIQATIIDNLRHQLWIVPVPVWVEFLLLIGGCLLGFAVTAPNGLPARIAGTFGSCVALLLGLWLLLRFGRVWASPAEPITALTASFAFLGLADFAAERQRRREIQTAFGQYVAPQIVRQIIDDPDLVKLGGERKMITVLFADVRGFTSISEALQTEPEKLTNLINDILTALSEIVTRHGGTIDKYIGDCVMAFWNAPLDDPDHALHAVSAALDMIETISAFGDGAGVTSVSPAGRVGIGVGVNSGECVVGNMGSHLRFDYTVMGDAVNVASRLEGLSKEYEVPLLVGDRTVSMSEGRFDYVEIGEIKVRGKQAAQLVYTIRDLLSGPAALAHSSGGVDG